MAGYSMELVLAIGYAFLAIIAFILELIARSMHQRTRELSPVSFTYHPERDGWNCPRDQYLFPVFSDRQSGKVVYRAPASVCNAYPSKADRTFAIVVPWRLSPHKLGVAIAVSLISLD